MRIYTTNYIKRPRKAFWSVCVAFLLLSSLLFGFVPQRTLATNNYVDDVVFDYEVATGYIFVSFHVKATFTLSASNGPDFDASVFAVGSFNGPGWIWQAGKTTADNPLTYTAGNTYKSYIYNTFQLSQMGNPAYIYNYASYPLDASDYIDKLGNTGTYGWGSPVNPTWVETDDTYYLETPTLTITFPEDDESIAESFYIEGSFTQPDPPVYNWLQAIATPAGILLQFPNAFYFPLSKASSTTAGDFTIWINNLSAGYYDFYIFMEDVYTGESYPLNGWKVSNIHLVSDLPFSLPPFADQPPYTAPTIFETLDPVTYYTANSGYETSTAFYTTFTDILAPVLLSLGQNLLAYSSNFTPSNASSTGNQIGESVVLIRSYLSNINSFFNNFPVSQFLVLYLIVLLLVVVMRLIKGLIHLFKPV